MNKVGKEITSYADYEVTDAEVKYRMENRDEFDYDEEMTEDEIRQEVYDSSIYEDTYNDVCYTIGEIFAKKFKSLCAKIEGHNLTWRNLSGHKYICLDSLSDPTEIGRKLIQELFSGGDFTMTCKNYGKGLFFSISHHDCPMGSSYYLVPCARSTYEANS